MSDYTKKFAGKGDKYHEYRPGYAYSTFKFLTEELGLTGKVETNKKMADIAAGTGFITGQYTGIMQVSAIEPDESMRRVASAELEKRQNNKVIAMCDKNGNVITNGLYQDNINNSSVVKGRSDATGLPDKSVDIIASGTAAHWFDPPSDTIKEWDRILKPEGKIALLFSFLDKNDATTNELVELYKDKFDVQWERLGLFQTQGLAEKFISKDTMSKTTENFIIRLDNERFLSWLGTTSGPTREQFTEEQLKMLNRFFDSRKISSADVNGKTEDVIHIMYKSSVYVGALAGREVAAEVEQMYR